MAVTCVTAHAEDREALPSLRLCAGCHTGLAKDLRALPGLHADLAAVHGDPVVSRTVRLTRPEGRPDDRDPLVIAETRLPVRPEVAEARDQIRHDLVWWTRYVAEARGLTLPADEVPAIAAWLLRHVDWLSAQPDTAQEAPGVFRDLTHRARALIAPSGARRLEIGPCGRETGDGLCEGVLCADVRTDDDQRPSAIRCRECGLELPPETWRRFGREYLRTTHGSERMPA